MTTSFDIEVREQVATVTLSGRSARTRSRSRSTRSCATPSARSSTPTTCARSSSPARAATSARAATCTRSSGRSTTMEMHGAARVHADDRRSRQGDAHAARSRSSRPSTASAPAPARSWRWPATSALGTPRREDRVPVHAGRACRLRHGRLRHPAAHHRAGPRRRAALSPGASMGADGGRTHGASSTTSSRPTGCSPRAQEHRAQPRRRAVVRPRDDEADARTRSGRWALDAGDRGGGPGAGDLHADTDDFERAYERVRREGDAPLPGRLTWPTPQLPRVAVLRRPRIARSRDAARRARGRRPRATTERTRRLGSRRCRAIVRRRSATAGCCACAASPSPDGRRSTPLPRPRDARAGTRARRLRLRDAGARHRPDLAVRHRRAKARRTSRRSSRGKPIAAFALSEPRGRQRRRARSPRPRARRRRLVLDGAKTWISNGGLADTTSSSRAPATRPARWGSRRSSSTADAPGLRSASASTTIAPHPLGDPHASTTAACRSRRGSARRARASRSRWRRSTCSAPPSARRRSAWRAARSTKRSPRAASAQHVRQAARRLPAHPGDDRRHGARRRRRRAARLPRRMDEGRRRASASRSRRRWRSSFATEAAQRVIDCAVQLHGGARRAPAATGRAALPRRPRAAHLRGAPRSRSSSSRAASSLVLPEPGQRAADAPTARTRRWPLATCARVDDWLNHAMGRMGPTAVGLRVAASDLGRSRWSDDLPADWSIPRSFVDCRSRLVWAGRCDSRVRPVPRRSPKSGVVVR